MIWILIGMALISFFQLQVLFQKKERKELLAFMVMLFLATGYAVLFITVEHLLNPYEILRLFFDGFYELIGFEVK